jgi:hypothetical protein
MNATMSTATITFAETTVAETVRHPGELSS